METILEDIVYQTPLVRDNESESDVIGEGAFGCVVQPTLPCETPHKDSKKHPDKYLSKIMLKETAEEEIREFELLSQIPRIHQYIVPKPHLCKPKETAAFHRTVKKCKNKRFRRSNARFAMFIMENGGVDLDDLTSQLIFTLSPRDVRIFLNNLVNLLEGICLLYDYNVIHHDIKLQNVVYNIRTGQLRLIDFGKTKTFDQEIMLSKQNINDEGLSWFNYPVENSCVNTFEFHQKRECATYRNTMDYDVFLQKSVSTFDMYSTGLVFKEIGERLYSYRKLGYSWNIPNGFLRDCQTLFANMYNPDLKTRNTHPCSFKDAYIKILKKHKMRETAKQKPRPSVVAKTQATELSNRKKHSVDDSVQQSLTRTIACPPEKEYNPFTKKCVRKCGFGKYRKKINPTQKNKRGIFKCARVKSRTRSNSKK